MSTPKKKQYTVSANPTVQSPYSTPGWFVPAPSDKPSKFIRRPGNDVLLMDCGEEYLPRLHETIMKAQKSIYIVIWGFDPNLPLVLDSKKPKDTFGAILEERAKSGIEIKILVWFNMIAATGSQFANDSSFFVNIPWNVRAMKGKIQNIELITRDPGGSVSSGQTQAKTQEIDERIKAISDSAPRNGRGYLYPKERNQINLLKEKRNLLTKVGYGAYHAQQQRWGEDDFGNKSNTTKIPTGTIGSFPTHHQKTVLIDHELPNDAVGFVQGFNFWEKYFDNPSHPYRGKNKNRIQDVGIRLKGPILIDIYNNFSQSWNQQNKGSSNFPLGAKAATPVPDNPPHINAKGVGINTINCQIIRTWRDDNEFNINAFYHNAFSKINHFIYVEDQYLRQPEFARAIKERAKKIRNKSGSKKVLHVFAITNPNSEAIGGIDVRAGMMDEFNRTDANVSEKQFEATQKSKQELDKIKKQMEQAGVMVHICRLRNSKLLDPAKRPVGHAGRGWKAIRYGSVYVHSKLTMFDNAYLTLGSANWNHRSMFTDTEVNIAVQCHNNIGEKFRKKLWGYHLNGLWNAQDMGSKTTPKQWYKEWDELLRKNFFAYTDKKSLIMNLFPYYEDIDDVKKRAWPIMRMKQAST